jgi:hypothetical protein
LPAIDKHTVSRRAAGNPTGMKRRIVMNKKQLVPLVVTAMLLIFISCTTQKTEAQNSPAPSVRAMTITGEIGRQERNGTYIIRGQVPAEIFTILNPDPKTLDTFVDSAKIVPIEVRVVSGDNVEIKKIDGKNYSHKIE